MDTLYIVIPAYNEEDNIENVVREWYPVIEKQNESSRLVIIDDGSKDSTYKLLCNLASDREKLVVLSKDNSGHGATVRYGYQYALDCGADYIFQTDSDGQTLPEELEQFWNIRAEYDVVIGHRKKRQDGWSRYFVTKVLKLVIRMIFGVWVTDANTPFRLMNREVLEKFIDKVPEDYNLTNVLLTVIFTKERLKIKYISITFRSRQGGVNSINFPKIFGIGKQAITDFMKINDAITCPGDINHRIKDIVCKLLLLFFSLSLVIVSPLAPGATGTISTDSSVFLYIGKAISRGLVPYRDVFDHKGPLLYFLNWIGSLQSINGVWVIEFIAVSIAILFSYKLCKRIKMSVVISTIVVVCGWTLFFDGFEGGNYAEEYSLPFMMIALYYFVINLYERDYRSYTSVIIGVCAGAVLMIRPNGIGIWAVFGIAICIELLRNKEWKIFGRYVKGLMIGVLVVVLPFLAYLSVNQAVDAFIADYLLFNFSYSKSSVTDVGNAIIFLFNRDYIPTLIFAILIMLLWYVVSRRKKMQLYCGGGSIS